MRQPNDVPTNDRPEYDPVTEMYYARYDRTTDGTPSRCVVETVATATGTDPLDMEPLYETVDPDHLDRLFESAFDRSLSNGSIAFRFEGCDVTVDTDGLTTVSPPDTEQP